MTDIARSILAADCIRTHSFAFHATLAGCVAPDNAGPPAAYLLSVVCAQSRSAAFRACVENALERFVLALGFSRDFEDEDEVENEEEDPFGQFHTGSEGRAPARELRTLNTYPAASDDTRRAYYMLGLEHSLPKLLCRCSRYRVAAGVVWVWVL